MSRVKVGTDTILNQELDVYADTSGYWELKIGNESIGTGDTIEKAKAKARTFLAKRKVKVEVNYLTHEGKLGACSGRHAKTRKLLVRVGNVSSQTDAYRNIEQPLFKVETPREVIERCAQAKDEIRVLEQERREIIERHSINLSDVVDKAIAAKAEEVAG